MFKKKECRLIIFPRIMGILQYHLNAKHWAVNPEVPAGTALDASASSQPRQATLDQCADAHREISGLFNKMKMLSPGVELLLHAVCSSVTWFQVRIQNVMHRVFNCTLYY